MKALHSILAPLGGALKARNFPGARSRGKAALVIVVLMALAFGVVPQEGWGSAGTPDAPDAPWFIYPVDTPDYFADMTDRVLRFKSDGTPCTVYGGDTLYYSCYSSVSGEWAVEFSDPSLMVGSYASFDFNDLDKPYIAYYDGYRS